MNAAFNYCGSTTPLKSPSKISKAILISLTYSTGKVNVAKSSARNYFFYGTFDWGPVGFFGGILLKIYI